MTNFVGNILASQTAAVLDGFGNLRRANALDASQIGQRSRYAQNAVIAAGGKPQLGHGLFEQRLRGGIGLGMLFDFGGRQRGVGFALAYQLKLTRGGNALAHYG